MTKKKVPYIIVVEGTSDVALLAGFLETEFITTNGSEVSHETINYLKEASKTRDIVILTDPDFPGQRIRDLISNEVPNALHTFVPKDKSIKKGKVGVAECSKEEILKALDHLIPNKGNETGNLSFADLYELGLIGDDGAVSKREKVAKALHLGHCNGKTLLKRANALNLCKKDLEDALNG